MLSHLAVLFVTAPPPLRGSRFAAVHVPVVPTVAVAAAGILYGWGVARLRRRHPRHPWSVWRTVAFYAALAAFVGSVDTFLGVYDRALFWDHMVQHLALIMVAAGLLAAGSPMALAVRATSGRTHQAVVAGLRSRPARALGHPIVAFVVYALVIPITHLTSFYNLTIDSAAVNQVEHVIFLLVGYLFWRQVFGIEPNTYRLHPALKLAYLFLAVPVDTFTGLSLINTTHEIFSGFTAMHRTWGPGPVTDLHLGGTVMWVVGDTLMMLAMIPVAVAWLRREERRAVFVDRELDRMLPRAEPEPARSGWRGFLPPSQVEAPEPPAAPPG